MSPKKSPRRPPANKPSRKSRTGPYASNLQWRFGLFAHETARLTGRPATFLLALLVIVVWGVTGPIFNYSDTWQLIINTGTTIVTFLMVFLIQNTQNRDTLAIQLKLSELILSMKSAPDQFAMIEDLSDEELEALHDNYRLHAEKALEHLEKRRHRPAVTSRSGSSGRNSKKVG